MIGVLEFLESLFTVISDYEFWCSWSLAMSAMQMCSFSDALFSNWRCRQRDEDCMN